MSDAVSVTPLLMAGMSGLPSGSWYRSAIVANVHRPTWCSASHSKWRSSSFTGVRAIPGLLSTRVVNWAKVSRSECHV